ncbi:neuronal acetylcholine receptor subunit alpha-7-like [Mizuhopecten yessoensis]|uniref:Neuronal acetylcholine receptor subunit alpha-7 n=1 Tax=Mizuhopecten yessoensis TaxID=6573 RepID=A0A210Q255_MIZYE|nr:neuronal acetylcholine receptor subunit alpha-7-like [Mizuhopecten yessoensis]OWF42817.1 Neuronal acetylcholine receptor subunit alpha-7 [Mizuhopecten yessoensis]
MVGIMKSQLCTWSRIFLVLYILSMLSPSTGEYTYQENDEDRLYKALMKYYVKSSRPVLVSNSTGFKVDLSISEPRLETLETATDTMTFSYWLTLTWQDERLQWNSSDFGGLTTIRFSPDSIWLPELEVYNVSPFHPSRTRVANAIVHSSGSVMYIPAQTISFFCPLDLAKFPYDTQKCKLVMGSWTFTSLKQDLTYGGKYESQEIPVAGFGDTLKSHPQWTLNKMTAQIIHAKYECCPETYVKLEIDITVTRIASYYRLALVGPSVFLAILIPVVFLLPPDQTCRTNYGMILLMTMTVLMVVLQEAVPFDHATVPVLAVFYFGIFVLQFFSILCCVLTGCLRNRGARRKALPAWLGSLCIHSRGVRRCLCLDTDCPVYHDPDTPMNMRLIEEQQDTAHDSGLDNVNITVPDDHFREVANNTKIMAGKIMRESTYDKLQRDWQEVGRCLDRIFFVIFVVVIAIVALSTVL